MKVLGIITKMRGESEKREPRIETKKSLGNEKQEMIKKQLN